MRWPSLVLISLSVLAACASLPLGKPVLVLTPPAVLGTADAGPVTAAVRQALLSRYDVQAGAPDAARALIDVVPGDSADTLRVYVRVVAAGQVVWFAAAPLGAGSTPWAWTLQQAFVAVSYPLSAASGDAALDEALRGQNFLEAQRLADVGGDPALRRLLLDQEYQATREEEVKAALTLLQAPKTSARGETLLRLSVLELLRAKAAFDLAPHPAVATAFKTRFGRDAAFWLDRPALVLVEGGQFSMGSEDETDERPLHNVTLKPFLMGRTEVTQAEYSAVTGTNPSLYTQNNDSPRRPVERVTWFDAVEYCNKLSLSEGLEPVYTLQKRSPATGYPIVAADVTEDRTRNGYRLPSEAEWEWAARGGVSARGARLAGENDPALVAWTEIAAGGPQPAGEKAPNELGLDDLSGNVWEWCSDWYGRYPEGAVVDPSGAPSGILKVGRGGSWHAAAWNARVTARSFDNPGSRGGNLGFRVVRSLGP